MSEKTSVSDEDLFGRGADDNPVFTESQKNFHVSSEERRKRFKQVGDFDVRDGGPDLHNGNKFKEANPNLCSNNVINGHSILKGKGTNHVGTKTKPLLSRAVSFQEDDDVHMRPREDNRERMDSEEAKERRESYRRSSGYGTGSGESCSKSSQHSQDSQTSTNSSMNHVFFEDKDDAFVENSAAPSDKEMQPLILYKSIVEQLDQEENDDRIPLLSLFKERLELSIHKERESVSTVSETKPGCFFTSQMNPNPNSNQLPALSLLDNAHIQTINCSDRDIFSFPSNKSSCKAPATINSEDSSVEVAYKTESLSDSIKFVQNHYCGNGPGSGDQAACWRNSQGSGSSSSPWTGDFLWQFVKSDPEIFQEFARNPSLFQSLFPNMSFNFSPNNSPSDINQLQNELKNDLPLLCRCRDVDCENQRCNQIRTGMVGAAMALKENIAADSSPDIMNMLQLVYSHAKSCEETRFKCPVKMCHLFHRIHYISEPSEVLQHLIRQSVPLLTLKDFYADDVLTENFYKLTTDCEEEAIPDLNTIPLIQFGHYGNVILYNDDRGDDHTIKKVSKTDRDEWNFHCIYERLRNKNHPSIVPHLWFMNAQNNAYICTLFSRGGNLLEYLQKKSFLIPSDALYLIKQILEGAVFLHHLGIVYLFWSATNMLFTNTHRNHVQLSNFSMSVAPGEKFDVGFLQTSLPPCIVPPELVTAEERDTLSVKADSWGIGCLLGEMVTGKQMWHKYRHHDRSMIFQQVRDIANEIPMTTKDLEKLSNDLTRRLLVLCWEKNPEQRVDATQILECLCNNTL